MPRQCRPFPDGLFDSRTPRSRTAGAAAAPPAPPLPADADAGPVLPEELVIPDDLSGLDADEIQALHDQAVEAFNNIYGDGTADLSQDDFDTLAAVTEAVERLRGELDARATEAADRRAALGDLAGRVNPAPADPDAPAEGDAEDDAEGDPDAEPADPDAPADPQGQLAGRRIPLSQLRQRTGNRRPARPAARPSGTATSMRDLVTAAADMPGFSNGQGLNWAEVGRAVDQRLRGFNQSQFAAYNRAGHAVRQQFGVAVIRRPIPEELIVSSNDPAHVDAVIRRAADQSRLPGGSLLAAGGWCAPSTILYDLLELESGDGIISVPEIGVARGGIQFTTGPDFSDIYNATGFTFSETQDQAGSYSGGTNEAQTVTVTGTPTGGTFTLTFDGVTTDPIAYNATAAQVAAAALIAVQIHEPGATLTGTGGPLPGTAVVLTFGGTLAGVNVAQMTATGSFTGGTTPAVAVTTSTPGVAGTGAKPCYSVTCPTFTEERLDLMGLCITSGLLQQRGYPEVLARTTRGALIAHEHRMAAAVIARMIEGSTAVTVTAPAGGTTGLLLTAIEVQSQHYRYVHRMQQSTTLEAVFPFWAHGAIRTDLSKRLQVNYLDVTDAQINAWFAQRGIAPQFVYNWQDLTGAAGANLAWPASLSFLMYAAGTWVKGTSDIISLDTIYDSVNLGQNDFTALFTEEGFLVAKRGFDSRVVTVATSGTPGT